MQKQSVFAIRRNAYRQANLDDFVTRKSESGDIGGTASHQISVENAEHALMSYDK